jgi:hypothetical protein
MRSLSFFALVALLGACSSGSEKKPQKKAEKAPATKIAAVPAPPVDAGPPADPIRVHFRIREPARLFARDYLLEGTVDGGTLIQLERTRGGRGEVARTSRSPLTAAAVGELFAELDAAQVWSLTDASAAGAPITQTLEVRRGEQKHRFEVKGPCWCDSRCVCPQAKAIDAANVFFHRAPLDDRVSVNAPVVMTMAVAPLELEDGGTPPRAVVCDVGPTRALSCEKKKCVRQGKQAACFESPFDADAGVSWVTVKAERKSRGPGWELPWAFRTAGGKSCLQKPWPNPRGTFDCTPAEPRVSRVFSAGKAQYVELADPEWSVDAITEVWR